MSNSIQNGASSSFDANVTFRLPALANCGVKDAGQVRLGGLGPVFRGAAVADEGKVRLGGLGPVFRATVADAGRVRLGGLSPLFR